MPGVPLFKQQVEAIQKTDRLAGRSALFMEMRTGKTRSALVYARWKRARRILVVCPITAVSAWEGEAEALSYPLPVLDLIVGTIAERAATLRRLGDAVVLINYESYWRKPLRDMILRWAPDTVILDEGHRIRHRGTRMTRFAHTLGDRSHVQRKLLLSGTPISNGLQDAWSLYRFINPDVFGRVYKDFEARYLVMGGFQMREVKKFRNVEEMERLIDANSYQCKRESATIPRDEEIVVKLDERTRAVYETLKKKAIVEIENAATGKTQTVVAQLVLTMVLRLQQIACGFTRDVGEDPVEISNEKARYAVQLITDAMASGEKVVVFARFLHDLSAVEALLPANVRTVRIQGGMSSQARKEAIAGFRQGRYDVVLGQIKAASLGIDLTAASVAIFISVGYSLDDFLQAKARTEGPNQTRQTVCYHLIAEKTVDQKVYKILQNKIAIAGRVTNLSYALDLIRGDG